MFARVSSYRAPDADGMIEGFRSVTEPLETMDGFSHAYFLIDRAGGKALSMTVWKTAEAMAASAAKADELRRAGTQVGGGSIEAVEQYEIALTVQSRAPMATA